MSRTALLVVDVQVGMFPETDPVYDGNILLERIQGLIGQAKDSGVPVIFVQHNEGPGEQLETGTADWKIHPSIAPEPGELLIQKHVPDSFHETELQEVLTEMGIERLVITGIQTDICIEATSRRASELGYDVTVVSNAHSTWGQGERTAAQIIEEYNGKFRSYATLEEASQISF